MRIPPKEGGNPVYDIIYAFKLLLQLHGNNLSTSSVYAQTILPKVRGIFLSESVTKVFFYLCLNGATTAWILQCQLEIPETTAYSALKRLRSLGFISPAIRVFKIKGSKGGPHPTIWSLEGASTEAVAKTLKLHCRLLSPKYRIAEKLAQTILEEYLSPRQATEITYREIVIQVKALKIPFRAPDIADLAASYLHEKGIKVWR